MLIKKFVLTIVYICTLFVGSAYAASTWTPPDSWDYGIEIAKPLQVPTNQQGWASDPRWQMLGDVWGVADGVSWATSDNPGVFGHEDVRVGSQVTFKFDMYKTLYGTHALDGLRAWIDLDKNGFSSADIIIQDQFLFNPGVAYPNGVVHSIYSDDEYDVIGSSGPYKPSVYSGEPSAYYANLTHTFISAPVIFTETGYFDLLARVTCSRDLGAWRSPDTNINWDLLTPWANGLTQGEVENWKIHVVPIPPAFLLFGSGLLSMGFFRRKFKPSV